MTTDPAGPSKPSIKKRLTVELGDELLIYGMVAAGFLIFLAASAPGYFGVSTAAATVRQELATLPRAPGPPPGTRAVLTGTIAKNTPTLLRTFVAYVEEAYNAGGKMQTSGWKSTGGKKQTFRIETTGGAMTLERPAYSLSPRVSWSGVKLLPVWDHVEARVEEPPGNWSQAKRFRGLVAGGPVTAVGTVTAGRQFEADYVVGAGVDAISASLAPIARGAAGALEFWLVLFGLGGFLLTLALFIRSRLRHFFAPSAD